LLKKHGQLAETEDYNKATKSLLGKRRADQLDSLHTVNQLEAEYIQEGIIPFEEKRCQLGEKFAEFNDFFALDY
jgi:hypothetical protein